MLGYGIGVRIRFFDIGIARGRGLAARQRRPAIGFLVVRVFRDCESQTVAKFPEKGHPLFGGAVPVCGLINPFAPDRTGRYVERY